MKKLFIVCLFLLSFSSAVFSANTSDGNWQTRRPDWTRDKVTYTSQEQANLIMRRLMPYVSSYYGIEVVGSSDNIHVLAVTIPADYNVFYPTMTLQAITNVYTQTITVSYECNFIGFSCDTASGTVVTNLGNMTIPKGQPVNATLSYYITPTCIFSGLTPQSTYYLMTIGRVPKP